MNSRIVWPLKTTDKICFSFCFQREDLAWVGDLDPRNLINGLLINRSDELANPHYSHTSFYLVDFLSHLQIDLPWRGCFFHKARCSRKPILKLSMKVENKEKINYFVVCNIINNLGFVKQNCQGFRRILVRKKATFYFQLFHL